MKARRRFAQHFLEPAWVRKLVAAIDPQPGDAFVEIGPGHGAITAGLLESAGHVTAVEIDRDLAAALSSRFPSLDLVVADVLDVDLASALDRAEAGWQAKHQAGSAAPASPRRRLAGNLPYNISTPILLKIMAAARADARLADATIMVQREVADRMAARPGGGDFGPLAVLVQLRADIDILLRLPPGAFRPPPQVESAVVRLRFRPPAIAVSDEDALDALVRAIFSQRRKTLTNALRAFAHARGQEPQAVIERAGLDGRRRPETLQLAELARLADALGPRPEGPVL